MLSFLRCDPAVAFDTERFEIIRAVIPHIPVLVMYLRCNCGSAVSQTLCTEWICIQFNLPYPLPSRIISSLSCCSSLLIISFLCLLPMLLTILFSSRHKLRAARICTWMFRFIRHRHKKRPAPKKMLRMKHFLRHRSFS